MIPESHLDLLTGPVVVTLATVMPNGQPQATPVWCDYVDGYIRLNTAAGRRKDKNMSARPQVTVLAIDPQNPYRWLEVRGKIVDRTLEGAVDHIHSLSVLYRGKRYYGESAPAEREYQETRVIYRLQPEKVNTASGTAHTPPAFTAPTPTNLGIIPAHLVSLLTGPVVVSLVTVMKSGQPQATPVWCSFEDGLIWLNTAEGRQKEKNLRQNPSVSILAVDPQDVHRWIEVRGRVVERTTEGGEAHIDRLTRLYTQLDKYFGGFNQRATAQTMTRVIYKIQPERINQDT
jgi:PPOX class probable F420-dependent enzyme